MSPISDINIRHGGDLQNALAHYGGSADEWLDLSTGISPWSYPVSALQDSTWNELPYSNDKLIAAAASCYGCDKSHIISSPGSQLAIRLIPTLIDQKQTVAIPLVGYQEHAKSWQMAGHSVIRYRDCEQLAQLIKTRSVNNAVVINPNNPTAEKIAPKRLKQLSENLTGILLIDEAFSDIDKPNSVCSEPFQPKSNIVVLKSIGKFFGLAGARVGFTIGTHPVIMQLNQLLSPWSISGPSIKLATEALNDTEWQAMQRQRVSKYAQKQRLILGSIRQTIPDCQCNDQGLFFSIFAQNDDVTMLHTRLAEQKIWTRLGDSFASQKQNQQSRNWLRLSLAGEQLNRLSTALKTVNINQISTKQSSTNII